jgi:hypothetical protein
MIHATLLLAALVPVRGLAPAPTAVLAASNPVALERALATIAADEIRSDLYFLASDELGGRDTPSAGQRIAARFLRARLERFGFEAGAAEGDYFYEYQVGRKRIDEAATQLGAEVGGNSLAFTFASDWSYYTTQDLQARQLEGSMVWCGSGLGEELANAKPAGKWVVCRDGKGSPFKRRREAQEAKALGVLVLQSREAPVAPLAERFGDTIKLLREGMMTGPAGKPAPELAPCLYLGAAAAERLLGAGAGKPVDAVFEPGLGMELGTLRLASHLADKGGTVELENVVGYWPGSDPELSKEAVILSAHYDHVGTRNGEVFNGADDNGSGTSTLLAVCEALSVYGPMRRSVLVIWVSGEEKGLWGSNAFATNPWLPNGARAVADINIDMVGRNEPEKLLVTPTEKRKEYNGLTRLAEQFAPLEGFPKLGSADNYYSRSDHIEFARLGIPVVFLFSDVHEDYHKPGDDPEKIDYDKVSRVARLVTRMLDGLQGDKLEL